MYKKLILACMAIAAFVIAPEAQATVLTEAGSALAVGSSVTGKDRGISQFTGGFGVECEVHLQGVVLQNNGSVVKMEIPIGDTSITNASGGPCTSSLGNTTWNVTSKLCLETVKGTDSLMITGCGGNVVFDLTASGVTCKYETASLRGTFTTNSTPATITVSEQPAEEVGGLFFCPDTGSLDMGFNLYTTGGTGLTVS